MDMSALAVQIDAIRGVRAARWSPGQSLDSLGLVGSVMCVADVEVFVAVMRMKEFFLTVGRRSLPAYLDSLVCKFTIY